MVKCVRTAGIVWVKVTSPAFYLHQASAIMVAQGLLLQDLFSPASRFVHTLGPEDSLCGGPFILLKGELSKLEDPTPRLKDLVLASIVEWPSDYTKEQLFSLLLEAVR
jgi:hypothetical protein